MKIHKIAYLFTFLCLSFLNGNAQSTLKVGLEQVAMKIPNDEPMWGYFPIRKSIGTLDSLYARIFYFEEEIWSVTGKLTKFYAKF